MSKKKVIVKRLNSIQNFVDKDTMKRYNAIDVNVYQENMFHTKMMLNEFKLDDYLFHVEEKDLSAKERTIIVKRLQTEIQEIFYGSNIQ